MIFSEQWIREWVNPVADTQQLTDLLTMAGLEVNRVSPVANIFSNIVVGLVETVARHPDADKLSICQVTDGQATYQVVCGAPNVRAGMKAPFARIGAEIRSNASNEVLTIKKAKLRGVESSGMLCSSAELGLAESSDGLLDLPADAEPGIDINIFLSLDDKSIELDLTPNRGDCLGIMGLAREIGVLTRTDVQDVTAQPVVAAIKDTFDVKISAQDECPRYLGRVIRGINLGAETPLWMREKLRRCGVRCIDPVVDVTNFVLIELGQPMHAFDLSKLEGYIDVRLATASEKITLLDGKEVVLTPDTLVIADAKKAVAIAGIMGGMATAVSDQTTDVFLECAFFAPLSIAGRARSFGMHTDASHRYERGVDYELQQRAMERSTGLLLQIAGGRAGPVTEAIGTLPERRQVTLRFAAVQRLLGISIPEAEIKDILKRLGLILLEQDENQLLFVVPSFRFDIEIEADLIEELARVYGYNKLPKGSGLARQVLRSRPESVSPLSRIKRHLVSQGYQEVITYSFIEPALAEKIAEPEAATIVLPNPISTDMSVMRGSLIPGLLATLKHNQNRQQARLRIFESGLVFLKKGDETCQPARIAGLISGTRNPNNWTNNKELFDYYDIKGDVENLLLTNGIFEQCSFVHGKHRAMHNSQCANVFRDGKAIGSLGVLHPTLQRELDIASRVCLFELDLGAIQTRKLPRASELSRYPEVTRDLALVVENSVAATEILALVRATAGEYLTDLRIFDVYQGDAVGKNKKSIALGLTWQHPSRTLGDDDVNSIITSCVNALEQQFNAKLRN